MEELMVRIEGQVDQLARAREDLARENLVLRRENERLRGRLSEVTAERDRYDRRVRLSGRHVETALHQLSLLTEEG